MTKEYLYESFLPYKSMIELTRWIASLSKLQKYNNQKRIIKRGKVEYSLSDARMFYKNVYSPGYTPAELSEEIRELEVIESLNEEDKVEYLEEKASTINPEKTRAKYNQVVSNEEVQKYINDSIQWLSKKIVPACNKNQSFIEAVIPEVVSTIRENNQNLNGIRAIFYLWFLGKVYNEKELPYKVHISSRVAEAMNVDPAILTAKLNQLHSLHDNTYAQVKKLVPFARVHFPAYLQEITSIIKDIEAWRSEYNSDTNYIKIG